jgi:hypothetical protein
MHDASTRSQGWLGLTQQDVRDYIAHFLVI